MVSSSGLQTAQRPTCPFPERDITNLRCRIPWSSRTENLSIARDFDMGLSASCYGVSFFQIDTLPEKRMSSAYLGHSEKYQFPIECFRFIYRCSSSQRTAQCAKQAEPIGQTSSLNRTFGLCAGASPRSSIYPAERYMNTLGTLSAIVAKSSEALADVSGTGVRPGIGSSFI